MSRLKITLRVDFDAVHSIGPGMLSWLGGIQKSQPFQHVQGTQPSGTPWGRGLASRSHATAALATGGSVTATIGDAPFAAGGSGREQATSAIDATSARFNGPTTPP